MERVNMPSRNELDVAAFVDFAQTAQHRLRRTAFLMTGDWSVAADLTQEALIKLYVSWPRLDHGGGLPTYARRTIVTTVLDYQRSRRRRPEVLRAEVDVEVVPDGTMQVVDREALLSGLRRISPRQRACIVLRYFESLSIAETAAAIGCSQGSVKSHTSAALTSLRRELGPLDLDPGGDGPVLCDPAGGRR